MSQKLHSPHLGAPVPAALSESTVFNTAGEPIPLQEFWRKQAALLVFLRHFGCVGCDRQVSELSPHLAQLRDWGVKTVFIGNGQVHFVEGFIERHQLSDKEVQVVTDPSLAAFLAAGLQRSWAATFGPKALVGAVGSFAKGYRQTSIQGDTSQQGGILIVDSSGCLQFHYVNRHLTDTADPADVLEAAKRTMLMHASPTP
ncbi:MAG: peroxiredoxin-like family protein [Myxococcota bacterium]